MFNNIKRIKLAKEIEDPYYLKDPILLELYKKSLPPKESYYYFPKGEEIIIHNIKKPIKSLRRVFYNVPYTSDLMKGVYEKILLNDSCNLIMYEESAVLHQLLLNVFIEHIHSDGKKVNECPIT